MEEVIEKIMDPTAKRYILWVGFIASETETHRKVEYAGAFLDTKKEVLGKIKVMLDNTAPYKILFMDTKPIRESLEEDKQKLLTDFFKLEG